MEISIRGFLPVPGTYQLSIFGAKSFLEPMVTYSVNNEEEEEEELISIMKSDTVVRKNKKC